MDYFLGQPRSRRTRCYLQLLQSRSLWGIRPSHEICLSFMWWIGVYFSAFAIFIPFWANSQIVCVDIFWNFWTPGTKQVTFFLPDEVFLDGSAEIFFLKWELHPSNWFRSGGKVATNQVKGGIWSADIFNVLLPSGHMLLIHVYIYIYIFLKSILSSSFLLTILHHQNAEKHSAPLGQKTCWPSWDLGICCFGRFTGGPFPPDGSSPGDSGVSPEEVLQSLGHCAPEYRTAGGGWFFFLGGERRKWDILQQKHYQKKIHVV